MEIQTIDVLTLKVRRAGCIQKVEQKPAILVLIQADKIHSEVPAYPIRGRDVPGD